MSNLLASWLMSPRAFWDLMVACARIRACMLWRVAVACFRTKYPLTIACIFTNPFKARSAFLACFSVLNPKSKIKENEALFTQVQTANV